MQVNTVQFRSMRTEISSLTAENLLVLARLFIDAFPRCERPSLATIRLRMAQNSVYKAEALTESGRIIGLLTHWTHPRVRFVEHLAVDANLRGRGLGSKYLATFLGESTLPTILEVEMPIDLVSRHRICFYESLGFVLMPHRYKQPSYHADERTVPMHLMVKATNADEAEVAVQVFLSKIVPMVYEKYENRTNKQ